MTIGPKRASLAEGFIQSGESLGAQEGLQGNFVRVGLTPSEQNKSISSARYHSAVLHEKIYSAPLCKAYTISPREGSLPSPSLKKREILVLQDKLQSLSGLKEILFLIRGGQLVLKDDDFRILLDRLASRAPTADQEITEDAITIDRVYRRYQQIISSQDDFEEPLFNDYLSLRYALAIEFPKKLEKRIEDKNPASLFPTETIKRQEYNLPCSIAIDSLSGDLAILLKKKSEGEVGNGGFKTVKAAFFLPHELSLKGTSAVEASSANIVESLHEFIFSKMFQGCPGHASFYLARHYMKSELHKDLQTEKIGLIMERYDGDMSDYPLNVGEAIHVTRQLLIGLLSMHEKGVVHGDIKPQNILYRMNEEDSLTVVLSDYGRSHFIDHTGAYAGYGTPLYASPQSILISAFLPIKSKIDIPFDPSQGDLWALGFTLLKLVVFQNSKFERMRSHFISGLEKEASFEKWSSDIYENNPVDVETAISASLRRKDLWDSFNLEVHRLLEDAKALTPDSLKELNFLVIATLILAHSQELTTQIPVIPSTGQLNAPGSMIQSLLSYLQAVQ